MDNDLVLDPIIPWVGGKRWLREKVAIAFKKSKAEYYVEPFCGGLACALEVNADKTIINDINFHLINLYQQIANDAVIIEKSDKEDYNYLALRDELNRLIIAGEMNTPYAAKIFYLVMRKAFNGLCRYSNTGKFNTTEGSKKLHIHDNFFEYTEIFKTWSFQSVDVCSLIVPKNSFIFFDSPYDETFCGYWKLKFSKEDFVRSVEWAVNTGEPILLTNNNTDFVLGVLKKYGFKYMIIDKHYSVAGGAKGRGKINEVIAWKNMRKPF